MSHRISPHLPFFFFPITHATRTKYISLLFNTLQSIRAVLNVPIFSFKIAEFLDSKIRNQSGIVSVCDVDFQKSHEQNYNYVPYTVVVSNERLQVGARELAARPLRRAALTSRTTSAYHIQQLCPMNDCKLVQGSWSQGHYT